MVSIWSPYLKRWNPTSGLELPLPARQTSDDHPSGASHPSVPYPRILRPLPRRTGPAVVHSVLGLVGSGRLPQYSTDYAHRGQCRSPPEEAGGSRSRRQTPVVFPRRLGSGGLGGGTATVRYQDRRVGAQHGGDRRSLLLAVVAVVVAVGSLRRRGFLLLGIRVL